VLACRPRGLVNGHKPVFMQGGTANLCGGGGVIVNVKSKTNI